MNGQTQLTDRCQHHQEDTISGVDNAESIVEYLKSSSCKPWPTIIIPEHLPSPNKRANNDMSDHPKNNDRNETFIDKDRTKLNFRKLGALYPEWDEFYLLVCDICGIIIRPYAMQRHLSTKHPNGVVSQQQASSEEAKPPEVKDMNNQKTKSASNKNRTNINVDKQKKSSDLKPIVITTSEGPPPIVASNSTTTKLSTPIKVTAFSSSATTTSSSINWAKSSPQDAVTSISKPSTNKNDRSDARLAPDAQKSSVSTISNKTNSVVTPSLGTKKVAKNHAKETMVAPAFGTTKKAANRSRTKQADAKGSNGYGSGDGCNGVSASTSGGFVVDPTFYGLEPLSPPHAHQTTIANNGMNDSKRAINSNRNCNSTATGIAPSLSSSCSFTSSSPSSASSSSSASSTSLSSSSSMMTMVMTHGPYGQSRAIMRSPSAATIGRYQDRKWRNTYHVLRDAFF